MNMFTLLSSTDELADHCSLIKLSVPYFTASTSLRAVGFVAKVKGCAICL